MKPIENVYKDNLIIEYSKDDFMATILNTDEDIITHGCSSLEEAKKWVDNNMQNEY